MSQSPAFDPFAIDADLTDERAYLEAFLERQRALVRWKLEGATDEALRGVATPTGLTPLGVVRHLTNVERSWFRDDIAGEDGLRFDWTDDPAGGWRVLPEDTLDDLLDAYDAECLRCSAAVADRDLDRPGERVPQTLRWVLLHMIEETARHVGHLDLLRERADGVVGEDPGSSPA